MGPKPVIPVLVVAALLGAAPRTPFAEAKSAAPAGKIYEGPALVLDGDTIVIAGTRIRLFGIDAPEMRAWPWGPRARGYLDRLVAGKPVRCVARATDRYKRPVAICTVSGKAAGEASRLDLARALIRAGLATSYRIYSRRYDPDERAAQTAGAGVWASGK